MNKFIKEFKDRGYFYQCTNENDLSKLLDKEKIKGYIGFDCTAESLHVGSLLQIMCLRLLQKHGHRPIVLIGGGTTRIGDPSGKDKTRKILSEEEIEKNIKNIEKILKNYLDSNEPKTKPIFVNNYSWLKGLNYISFLRDIGKHFTINKMLTFESVKTRLDREQSLSYMEFNYMILQAYDFLELNKKENCTLQIGGSDQWGNIVNGTELIKRHSNKKTYGLTTPLITLKSRATDNREIFVKKLMGKTENVKFDIFGFNNIQPIWADQYFKTISNSKMGLNLSRGTPIKYYSSDRITQITGNGLVTLIDEKTQYNEFFSNNEMVFYNSISDLTEKINKISRDEKTRKLIGKKGKEKYMKYFNSKIVAEFIISKTLNIVNKNKYLWHDK